VSAESSSDSIPEILRTGSMLDRAANLVENAPRQLGPYRILQRIGEGGMGIVYLAEQAPPLARRVAIKVARTAGTDGRALARFESERQSLAVMNHPNIARVFDAGTTSDARPYFVMEHVAGESVTDYCDAHRLGLEPRLELFLRICDGVQHAHVNAIIHRDLKPSNILVSTESGVATPKIIDFGVAKALGGTADSQKGLTQFGQIVGTPEYMSPEQAALDGRPVDTRTDVYALGVLLYELLVGSRPFEREKGSDASLVDLCRRIREEEPERPSTRAMRASDANAAQARGLLPATLARRLRGDLDAIAMKALAKETERRYATPSDLSADLLRHRHHRPIVARPPSTFDRFSKSLRRHTTAWTLSAMLMGIAAVGAVVALRAHQEFVRAEDEKKLAGDLSEFLVGMMDPPEPVVSRENQRAALVETPAQGVLLSRIREGFPHNPKLQSKLLLAAGNQAIASNNEIATLREARDLIVSLQGPDSLEAIEADESLARAYAFVHRSAEGEPLSIAALERRRRRDGQDHPDTWRATARLAYTYKAGHQHDSAVPLFQAAIAGLERRLGPDDRDVLSTKVGLSGSYLALRRYRETQALLEGIIGSIRRVYGERDFQTNVALYNMACARANLGDLEPAFGYLSESIERGFAYPRSVARDPLLLSLHDDPRFDALDRAGRLNFRTTWYINYLDAEARIREGRCDEAERLLHDLIAAQDRGAGIPGGGARWNLAKCWIRRGRYEEAEGLLAGLLLASESLFGESITYDLLVQCDLGRRKRESALARIATAIAAADPELENVEILYLEAEREALRGQDRASLQLLARAAELGLDDFDRLENDLAFVKLRSRPEFQAVVRSARRHAW
jgi:eukaryotic-like serine/threonine-protein kinase